MPTSPLPDELRDFLAKPNPSVIATLRPDGQPVTLTQGQTFVQVIARSYDFSIKDGAPPVAPSDAP